MTQPTKHETTLAALIGAPVKVPVGTIEITVKPLGWYESIDAINAIMPGLDTMPPLPSEGGTVDLDAWMPWIQIYRDSVVSFCHLASGQDEELIAAIGPVQLIELVFGLIEVNADFFVRSLRGEGLHLDKRVQVLMNKLKAGLQINSNSSSPTATPGQS